MGTRHVFFGVSIILLWMNGFLWNLVTVMVSLDVVPRLSQFINLKAGSVSVSR